VLEFLENTQIVFGRTFNSSTLYLVIPFGTAFSDEKFLIFRQKIPSKYEPNHFHQKSLLDKCKPRAKYWNFLVSDYKP